MTIVDVLTWPSALVTRLTSVIVAMTGRNVDDRMWVDVPVLSCDAVELMTLPGAPPEAEEAVESGFVVLLGRLPVGDPLGSAEVLEMGVRLMVEIVNIVEDVGFRVELVVGGVADTT